MRQPIHRKLGHQDTATADEILTDPTNKEAEGLAMAHMKSTKLKIFLINTINIKVLEDPIEPATAKKSGLSKSTSSQEEAEKIETIGMMRNTQIHQGDIQKAI